jgi:hypothetical protein
MNILIVVSTIVTIVTIGYLIIHTAIWFYFLIDREFDSRKEALYALIPLYSFIQMIKEVWKDLK